MKLIYMIAMNRPYQANYTIKYLCTGLCFMFIAYSCQKTEPNKMKSQFIDLSYAYDSQTPFWPTADGFRLDTVFYGQSPGNYFYSAFSFQTAEHGGTHIDAPIHFAKGKRTVDEIPLDQLIGPGLVIDISEEATKDIDYLITVDDFKNWEKVHGTIPEGSIILLKTGYGKFWPDKKLYMGTDQTGPSAALLLHFPGLHPDAATWISTQRNIRAIGIDTPSIDYGHSSDFRAHRILMEENIPVFENLASLDQLPAQGFRIIALPMKIRGGSGGPLRIIAEIE